MTLSTPPHRSFFLLVISSLKWDCFGCPTEARHSCHQHLRVQRQTCSNRGHLRRFPDRSLRRNQYTGSVLRKPVNRLFAYLTQQLKVLRASPLDPIELEEKIWLTVITRLNRTGVWTCHRPNL